VFFLFILGLALGLCIVVYEVVTVLCYLYWSLTDRIARVRWLVCSFPRGLFVFYRLLCTVPPFEVSGRNSLVFPAVLLERYVPLLPFRATRPFAFGPQNLRRPAPVIVSVVFVAFFRPVPPFLTQAAKPFPYRE